MKENITIKQLPVSERPYEKCEQYGPEALSDAELLAVVIRSGTKDYQSIDLARAVLKHCTPYDGLSGLHYLTSSQLQEIKGIGRVKAIQLQCVCELSKRMAKSEAKSKLVIQQPDTIANYFMEEMCYQRKEIMKLIFLDGHSHLLGDRNLSIGTVNSTVVEPRDVFLEALSYHAVSLILMHNHPSGDTTPSKADIRTTNRLTDAGNLIGIPIVDHIIIGDHCYFSFLENKLL